METTTEDRATLTLKKIRDVLDNPVPPVMIINQIKSIVDQYKRDTRIIVTPEGHKLTKGTPPHLFTTCPNCEGRTSYTGHTVRIDGEMWWFQICHSCGYEEAPE